MGKLLIRTGPFLACTPSMAAAVGTTACIEAVKAGELDRETFNRKYQSRLGHMGHADTYHVTKAIEYDLLFWEFEQTQSGLLVPV